jgi:hypothetical protein
LSISQGK